MPAFSTRNTTDDGVVLFDCHVSTRVDLSRTARSVISAGKTYVVGVVISGILDGKVAMSIGEDCRNYLKYYAPNDVIMGRDNNFYGWNVFSDKTFDLESFVRDKMKPSENTTRNWLSMVEKFKQFLRSLFGSDIDDIVMGGSLAKKTDVEKASDLDLVLFFNTFKTVEEFRNNLPVILKRIKDKAWTIDISQLDPRDTKVTKHTVGFSIYYVPQTQLLTVDIVPAFAGSDPQEIYRKMQSLVVDDRKFFSSSLAKQQTEFVAKQPQLLKDFIVLLKFWRKTHLRVNEKGKPKIPKSYAMELIAIGVWESVGKPMPFAFDSMLKTVLLQLVFYESLDMTWTTYYTTEQMRTFSKGTRVHGKPFLLDPCDPFHNIGSYFDWKELADAAKETAKSTRLESIKPLSRKLEDMFQQKMAPVKPPTEDNSFCSIQ